jgi:NodT family efflux transporter outer membrane factor (OMF) lipoprotein
VRYGVREAAAQVDLQSYEFAAARRALAANIVIGAINAAALNETLMVNERLAQLALEQAQLTEKSYRTGASPRDALLGAQQSAASLEASLPPLRSQALRARHALAVLMGRTPDRAPPPLALSQLQLPIDVPVSLPSDLLQQRPDVLAAEASVHAAAAQVGIATANLFPRISLSASYGSASFHSSTLFTGPAAVWSAGATLAQPIFHGRALLAQRRAALANYDASVAQYRPDRTQCLPGRRRYAQRAQPGCTGVAGRTGRGRRRPGVVQRERQSLPPGRGLVSMSLASEQRWRSATLSEIQDSATRLIDTAALFQAMGTPPE